MCLGIMHPMKLSNAGKIFLAITILLILNAGVIEFFNYFNDQIRFRLGGGFASVKATSLIFGNVTFFVLIYSLLKIGK